MGKKEKIQITVIGLSVILLFIFSISSFKKVKKPANLKTGGAPVARKKVSKEQKKVTPGMKETAKDLRLARDPFSAGTLTSEAGPISDLSLSGILWDADNPLAIINDNIVKAGDKIGANRIVRIEQDSVILNDGTKDFRLNLE